MLIWKGVGDLLAEADLLLVSKLPVPGRVKTRLSVEIGAEAAAAVAAALLGDQLESLGSAGDFRILCGDGADSRLFSRWLCDDSIEPLGWQYRDQGTGDLGARLSRCCLDSFERGRAAVALLGADAPRYPADQIEQALSRAVSGVATLGPAGDGGYGLLALPKSVQSHLRSIFPATGWGTGEVAARVRGELQRMGVPLQLLSLRNDIDDGQDLIDLWKELQLNRQLAARLSRTAHQLRILRKEGWRGPP